MKILIIKIYSNWFYCLFFVMVAFSIWSLNIYWYGIFYLVWFLAGYFFLKWIWKRWFFKKYDKLQNLLYKNTDDILIAIILWVLIWGRLGEVFIYQWEYFSQNLLEIFAVWNWGMSFVWWIFWVLVALLILKQIKKINHNEFWFLMDSIVVIVPLAIFIWRFGNYLNQELYGLVVPENFWWMGVWLVEFLKSIDVFHIYESVDLSLRVNTNFLSMFFEWILLLVITVTVFANNVKKRKMKPGYVVGFFLLFYSFFRFFLEYLRIDSQSQFVWMFTRSQWIFIFFVLLWLWFIFNKSLKKLDL